MLSENLRTVRRTVNPERDPDAQAMLEMLERHGSRAGTVFAEQPRPLAVPLGHAAGKGDGTSGGKAPHAQRPPSGVAYCHPEKDPAGRGVDLRPDPRCRDNPQTPRRNEFFGTPRRESSGERRRPRVGAKKQLMHQRRLPKQGGR